MFFIYSHSITSNPIYFQVCRKIVSQGEMKHKNQLSGYLNKFIADLSVMLPLFGDRPIIIESFPFADGTSQSLWLLPKESWDARNTLYICLETFTERYIPSFSLSKIPVLYKENVSSWSDA